MFLCRVTARLTRMDILAYCSYKYVIGMETRLGVGMRMRRGMLIEMELGGVLGTPQAFSVSYII